MKILYKDGLHVVTESNGEQVLWHRMNKHRMPSFSSYHHFGGKLYGRHDIRNADYDRGELRIVSRFFIQFLLQRKGGDEQAPAWYNEPSQMETRKEYQPLTTT